MEGRVTWVAEFPSTARGMLRLLANESVVADLMDKGPLLRVDVALARGPGDAERLPVVLVHRAAAPDHQRHPGLRQRHRPREPPDRAGHPEDPREPGALRPAVARRTFQPVVAPVSRSSGGSGTCSRCSGGGGCARRRCSRWRRWSAARPASASSSAASVAGWRSRSCASLAASPGTAARRPTWSGRRASTASTAGGRKCEPEALRAVELPAILHWNFNHFVVLEGIDGDRVYPQRSGLGAPDGDRRGAGRGVHRGGPLLRARARLRAARARRRGCCRPSRAGSPARAPGSCSSR